MKGDKTLEIIPDLQEAPRDADYPSEEDSDDQNDFDLKVPDLGDLINEFEKDDDVLNKLEEDKKKNEEDLKTAGFEKEPREDIHDKRLEHKELISSNISIQRVEWSSRMPGMIEEMNDTITNTKNKLYLR
jgi:hypothetical protein